MGIVLGIAGTAFRACTQCHLPVDYFALYEKHYGGGPNCPFCEGLGQLPYTTSRVSPVRWGPCLYCHPNEYQGWLKTG